MGNGIICQERGKTIKKSDINQKNINRNPSSQKEDNSVADTSYSHNNEKEKYANPEDLKIIIDDLILYINNLENQVKQLENENNYLKCLIPSYNINQQNILSQNTYNQNINLNNFSNLNYCNFNNVNNNNNINNNINNVNNNINNVNYNINNINNNVNNINNINKNNIKNNNKKAKNKYNDNINKNNIKNNNKKTKNKYNDNINNTIINFTFLEGFNYEIKTTQSTKLSEIFSDLKKNTLLAECEDVEKIKFLYKGNKITDKFKGSGTVESLNLDSNPKILVIH